MTTPRLGLAELANGQANYLNANQAFAVLDAVVQGRAIDKVQTSAPGTHSDGDVRIMASAWSGVTRFDGTACAAGDIAVWRDSVAAWKAIQPKTGFKLELATDNSTQRFDGSAWSAWSPGAGGLPLTSKSADYTLVQGDANLGLLHPSADTTARTWTIPANSSVPYDVGTALTFVNQNAAGAITIAITTDTMRLAGAGTTGSRTLAANGMATALKLTSTEWIISGVGLT